jgi:hypothetical protein
MQEDGTEEVTAEQEAAFAAVRGAGVACRLAGHRDAASHCLLCQWLAENGATFPKIQWPSRTTVGGVRGTTALEDIETNEHMLCIPVRLMITPPFCRTRSDLRDVFAENLNLFRADDDMVSSVVVVAVASAG